MSLSSTQIAQLNGSFLQQHAANMQYAGMIGHGGYNFGGYNTGAQNEGLAARGMNLATGIGAPMATLGLGLMGLDPLSIGLRAGGAAMGSGMGLGSAAMVGAAAALPMVAGMGAIGYMGNQIMGGGQQAQQFNAAMRSGYSFFNPGGHHGRGFSEGGIREIGGHLRGMAGEGGMFELGPSFNELGRLASNMGRMGLADGVRNAKEFTEKFREMMKSVKAIAEDMGTTFEEAQKMMASMKGSGIFKNQAGVSGQIRAASVSGGLALTEVTGMMNIGSQISRMYGGTGKQGAMGGIRSIEQVGMAQQVGALSEEDIYQATGLYGAEGRRAMAQQNMMATGSFLRSSKGRWLLASLAGKDGELDRDSVNDFLAGGMGVNDTRRAARRNLRGVGRANFIRNEGRLRGAVMEEFGGLAPAMAMMGWAQSRGIDINSMGDREMLFMQRQMGLGRDEADALVKMARKLPDLLQHRREMREQDVLVREHGLREQNSGIEGVKRRLDAARNKVNNEMQRVGQDILNVATDKIAEWGNRLAGKYEEHSIAGLREAHRAALMGGKGGRDLMTGLIGGDGGFLRDLGGGSATLGLGGPRENFSQARYRDRVADLQFSARLGSAGGLSSDLQGLVGENRLALQRAYADELSGLSGEDRMSAFKRHFGKGTALGDRFRKMNTRDQAVFMQQMEGEIGIKSGRLSETFQAPSFGDGIYIPGLGRVGGGGSGLTDLVGGGNLRTNAQRTEAMGRSILGLGRSTAARLAEGAGGMAGSVAGLLGGGAGAVAMGLLGSGVGGLAGDVVEELGGGAQKARAAGAMLDDPEYRRLAFDTLTGAEGAEGRMLSAISNLRGLAAERGSMGELTRDELGRLGGLEALRMTGDLMKTANARGGVDKMTDADWNAFIAKRKQIVKEMGGDPDAVTKESILADAQGVQGAASEQRKAVLTQLASQAGKMARQEMQALRAGGVARLVSMGVGKGGGDVEMMFLTEDTAKKLRKEGGQGAVQAAQMALDVQSIGSRLSGAATPEEKVDLLRRQQELSGQLYDTMGSMDVKSLRALGSSMAGTQIGSMAGEMIMRGQALDAAKRKKGAAGAVAGQLGLNFSADELKGLKGMSPEAAAAALAARMGVGDDKGFVEGLKETIAAAGKKGGGIQGGALLQRTLEQASPETRKKLEEQARGQQSPDEKIIDKLGESNNYLKALVESNKGAKAALDAIRNNTSTPADGEKAT